MPDSYVMHMIVQTLLLTLSLLYVVPKVTDGGVAVRRNSFLRGALGLVVLALGNKILWHALVAMGAMQAAPTAIFTVGVMAWLVNAVVIFLTGKIMPGVLFVRSFSTSLGASLVLMLCGWLITWLI